VVPGDILHNEIQDEIRLVNQCGCGFWGPGRGREIQDETAFRSNSA
jgi:hypothetical protein